MVYKGDNVLKINTLNLSIILISNTEVFTIYLFNTVCFNRTYDKRKVIATDEN